MSALADTSHHGNGDGSDGILSGAVQLSGDPSEGHHFIITGEDGQSWFTSFLVLLYNLHYQFNFLNIMQSHVLYII